MLYNASIVKIFIGVILAILISATGWFVYQEDQRKLAQGDIEVNSPTITASPAPVLDVIVIPQNFQTFENQNFSIQYHPDMEVNDQEEATSFMLIGPSQVEGTEVYDGIILTVASGTYENQTYKEFVDSAVKEISSDGASEIIGGVISVSLGEKTGYEFELQELGDYRHIYFDSGNGNYLYVTLLMKDPKDAGFHDIMEGMLKSLKFK